MNLLNLLISLVIAISVHEAAHAYVAYKLGDPTAKNQGRLTLNPLAHLDFLGTLMLFIARVGWGKPVPVNPYNFKNPVKDGALVSFAGPASNFLTALVVSFPLKYLYGSLPPWAISLLFAIININIILGVFNLLPFPPLDGSKIFAAFVPKRYQGGYFRFLKKAQPFFFAFIIFDIFLGQDIYGMSILWYVIGTLFDLVSTLIFIGG